MITDESVHDSYATDALLNEKDTGESFYADSAYSRAPQEAIIAEKGMKNQVCKKGAKNHPLTEEQQASNREKSRVRSRVNFQFCAMCTSINKINMIPKMQ